MLQRLGSCTCKAYLVSNAPFSAINQIDEFILPCMVRLTDIQTLHLTSAHDNNCVVTSCKTTLVCVRQSVK